jgi:DNA polymerase II large subunit
MFEKECKKHGENKWFWRQEINIKQIYDYNIKRIGLGQPQMIKGVRGTSNKYHIPEHFGKGIIRAKHGVTVNKDGTIRYDISELPITHFKPKEIRTSVKKLKALGYTEDIKGNPLVDDDQILELRPQDLILPSVREGFEEGADKVLVRIARFIDDLLEKFYGMKPYYNLKNSDDLIGQLVVGLAPHISCGMVGRIIGFSDTQAFFASPMFHAALRRDCDGDEACVLLLMDAFLNFSQQYLPDRRGGRTMDAPLVLTPIIDPAEVDDMVFGLDVAKRYPLELYEAAQDYKKTGEVMIDSVGKRLGKESQYEGFGFTHNVSDINDAVLISSYKTLPSMQDKMKKQMELAVKVRAVKEDDVARLVIEKHFMKDLKGNLRKFSQQSFRCVNCNEIYRRPPLSGICNKCGGKIIYTISQGSVVKYLQPSLDLMKEFKLSPYLNQSLELLTNRIETMFGKESEKQDHLSKWF